MTAARRSIGPGVRRTLAGLRLTAAALATIGLVVAAGCTSVQAPGRTPSATTPPGPTTPVTAPPATPPAPTPPATTPATTPPPTPLPTSTTPTGATSSDLLRVGDSGPEVVLLQERLSAVGYWVGTADGKFGDATQQAVIAFQKVAGLDRDGVVGPQTAAALAVAAVPTARPVQGRAVEIDLRRQVLFIVANGQVQWAFNTSTGGGYAYYQDGRRHVAVTPVGEFTVTWQVNGWDHSPLGWLWRPKYFNGGIAVHGYAEVPAYPASHGCVRVSVEAMNWLWTTGAIPIGTAVIVY